MSNLNISGALTLVSKDNIKKGIEGAKAELPFLVSLTTEERKKLRKIGPNRLGYATEVNVASNANNSALASGFKLDEYNKDLTLFRDLTEVYSWVTPLKDAIENTLMALGAELMKQSDEAYGYLKVAASKNNDQNLNSTIKKITGILKQSRTNEKKA